MGAEACLPRDSQPFDGWKRRPLAAKADMRNARFAIKQEAKFAKFAPHRTHAREEWAKKCP